MYSDDPRKAGPYEIGHVLLLGRVAEANGGADEHQRRAEPADETENAIDHVAIHATVRCRPTWPSGTGRR